MLPKTLCMVVAFLMLVGVVSAQRISYTEPDEAENKPTQIVIIGKQDGNYLLFKEWGNQQAVAVYNEQMELVTQTPLEKLPNRLLNQDFFFFNQSWWMFYQYQIDKNVYAALVELTSLGAIKGKPIGIDTTSVTKRHAKVYTLIQSSNKKQLAIFKLDTQSPKEDLLTLITIQGEPTNQKKYFYRLPMPDRFDFLSEFSISNAGTVFFVKSVKNQQDNNITRCSLFSKPDTAAAFSEFSIPVENMYLDELHTKIDNTNNQLILVSFFSKTQRGNMEGLFVSIWNPVENKVKASSVNWFNEELRKAAKGENNIKTAFNDFFIRNLIIQGQGGFFVAAESYYTTISDEFSRGNYLFGSPFFSSLDYYSYNPYSYSPWGWYNRLDNSPTPRYNAENILAMSFDSIAKLQWTNLIYKSQLNENTDDYLGFYPLTTGEKIHFVFNQKQRGVMVLTDNSIQPNGQVVHELFFKGVDLDVRFMPRLSQQVAAHEWIMPCIRKNNLCFAKIEL